MTDSDRIVEIKTVQSNAIRILFEALKDILTDVNLQISSEGLKIISMDGSKQAVVNLKLEANKFEKFYCKNSIRAGLNMTSLYKIIKSVKNSDIITFYILSSSSTKLHIEIVNKEKKTNILTVLKLLDIDEDILDIPNIEFDTVKTMPSNDFQSYIRELSIITNKIKLESKNDTFSLTGEGDFAETKINVGDSNTIDIKTEHNAKGIFYIKYLLLFTKSTNLCTTVEIYLKNKFPLILVYNVANLGKLQYCLAPLVE
jgi:proliferating cell nuclear antigen